MITLREISYFLKIFTISAAIMMVFSPTVVLIVTTFVGLAIIGILDLTDIFSRTP